MKKILPSLLFLSLTYFAIGQITELPHQKTSEERALLRWQEFTTPLMDRFTATPPPNPVRHMAEWEELEALVITWRVPSYNSIYREIIQHAKEEVRVIVIVKDEASKTTAINNLLNNGIDLTNVEFLVQDNDSIWVRDYGPQGVYANEVEDQYIIDWIYNRPRPKDNVIPLKVGEYLNLPVYSTTETPDDLVHTGGNFLSDGLGTGFSSKLVLEENGPGNDFNAGPHTEVEIDEMMNTYLGIERYIKMNTLPYDEIHHIDMHMKLLDEETILMGQYPQGIADGPTIEANLNYVLSNFNSAFGKPYKVVRMQMPPEDGKYPHNGGDYRTYTNSVFVNRTILVPTYEQQFDTTALRIYQENFPGYKVVGINCNSIITQLGALHCITKEIGVNDPLLIVHDRLENINDNNLWSDYQIKADIKHRTGISNAQVFYTTDTSAAYSPLEMTLIDANTDTWAADIPHQANGSEIFYYIHAAANSSKEQVRPLVAPTGYYNFKVDDESSDVDEQTAVALDAIYPNPTSAITVVPVFSKATQFATIEIRDVLGKKVKTAFSGMLPFGSSNHFIHAENYLPGTYFVSLKTNNSVQTQKLIVK